MNTKSQKRPAALLLCAIVLCVCAAFGTDMYLDWINYKAPGWHDTDGVRFYVKDKARLTGLCELDDGVYYFDGDGAALYGWQDVGVTRRYFAESGAAAFGETQTDGGMYYFSEGGILRTGFFTSGDNTTYHDENGFPAEGFFEYEGATYYAENGVVAKGFKQIGGDGYYFEPSGARHTGALELDGGLYLFGGDGRQVLSWYENGGKKYFYAPENGGMMAHGMYKSDAGTYYFNDDGSMLTGALTLGADNYYFREDGTLAEGWQVVDGKLRYYTADGKTLSSWQKLGDETYYFGADGSAAIGETTIDGGMYLFKSSGERVTGWQDAAAGWKYYSESGANIGVMAVGWTELQANGKSSRHWFDVNGVAGEGLREVDGQTYYFIKGLPKTGWVDFDAENGRRFFAQDGHMATGVWTIGGERWSFQSSGLLLTGWSDIGGGRYYLDEHGFAATGAVTVGGALYYFGTDGVMMRGWVEVGLDKYYLYADGHAALGRQSIEGADYVFADNGLLARGWCTVGSDTYYYRRDNTPVTGKVEIGGFNYSFLSSGKFVTGWQSFAQGKMYLDKYGYPVTGWQTIGGDQYYFDENGFMLTDTEVDVYVIDKNGVATKTAATESNLDAMIKSIIAENGKSVDAIYEYVRACIKYRVMDKDTNEKMAVYALNYHRGACYHFAALTHYLLEYAGYENIIINGDGLFGASEHYWNMVRIDGVWRHLDTLQKKVLVTDSELVDAGYNWDFAAFPAAT